MRRRPRPDILCLLFSLLVWSCASGPGTLTSTTLSPDLLYDRVAAGSGLIRSMSASGSVTFESPEAAGSAFFRLALKKPDSLLLRLEGPFGIDVGFFFLSADRFVLYNRMENTVAQGRPDRGAIRSVIPFDLTTEEIISAFSGTFSLPPQSSLLASYVADGDRFVLTYMRGTDSCSYWVDPETNLVMRYQVRDRSGRVEVDAEASAVTEQDDLYAPRRVTVTFPSQDRQLSIYYSALTLNPPSLSFGHSVPRGARPLNR